MRTRRFRYEPVASVALMMALEGPPINAYIDEALLPKIVDTIGTPIVTQDNADKYTPTTEAVGDPSMPPDRRRPGGFPTPQGSARHAASRRKTHRRDGIDHRDRGRNVSKAFPGVQALRAVSFELATGERAATLTAAGPRLCSQREP